MSQFWLVNSCLLGTLDPWSFGDAPADYVNYVWLLTINITRLQVHAELPRAGKALGRGMGSISLANGGQRH